MRHLGMLCIGLLIASCALAQQTSIIGRVTDATEAVIVGARVSATPVEGGAAQLTVTNEQGRYQFPSLVAGDYRVRVELAGFAAVERTLTVLVGQTFNVEVTLQPAAVSSTVVVEGVSAAVELTSSEVSGNIAPGQMKDIPLNGRNWMELSLMVSGVTVNHVDFVPLGNTGSGKYQINVDGQQVTQNTAGAAFGQPQYSRDALSQFQIITNRFDATLGRSSQIQVNAQTKGGTNQFHGSAYGYFRNDSLNAADFLAKTVLPFSDQQYGGSIGGPIIRDKLWFFGAYERERQPSTIFTTPTGFGGQSFTFPTNLTTNSYLGRFDYQISSKNRLSFRADAFTWDNPFTQVAGTEHPSRAAARTRTSYNFLGDWTNVHGAALVNEVKAGYGYFNWNNSPVFLSQEYRFSANTIGARYNYPQDFNQNVWQFRDDLFWLKGKHSFKFGGDYLFNRHTGLFQMFIRGAVTSFARDPASFPAVFPSATDPSTWNLGAISSLANTYVQAFGNFNLDIPRNTLGFWVQDDWKITSRLTLNLGLRYDNDIGVFDPSLRLKSGVVTPRSGDNLNFAPRLGFAYDLLGNRRTVIRGGAGIYWADIQANQVIDQQLFNGERSLQVSSEAKPGRPISLSDPFSGATGADFLSGKVPVDLQGLQIMAHDAHTPYSLQASIGFEHQLAKAWTLQADFVHWRVYHDWIRNDTNLFYDPTTGFNKNPTVSGRPDTRFSSVLQFLTPNSAGGIYDGLQMELRKQLSAGLTMGAAYTLSRLKDSTTGPFYQPNNPFNLAGEWANSPDDQRHTLTVHSTYRLKWGFQVSGFYHLGSGNAYAVSAAGNPFGGSASNNRIFRDTARTFNDPRFNTPVPGLPGFLITARDQLYGRPIHRVDTRLSKTVAIHEKWRVIGIFEAFNLFNHQNYGAYGTSITTSSFSKPAQNLNLAYSPRMLQLAARFEF